MQGVELAVVFVMAVGRDANLKAVGRVHKEAPIFARHTEGVRGACGVSQVLALVEQVTTPVTSLQGAKSDFVLPMLPKFKTSESMVMEPLA